VVPATGAHHSQTTDGDGDTHDRYTLEVRGESFDIDWPDFASLHEGAQIPIRVASTQNWAIGASATIGGDRARRSHGQPVLGVQIR